MQKSTQKVISGPRAKCGHPCVATSHGVVASESSLETSCFTLLFAKPLGCAPQGLPGSRSPFETRFISERAK